MKRSCLIKLISLYFFVIVSTLLQADIRNLDGLWKIVPQEYKQYSLIHGAILWETGWVNNFYRFANYYPIESLDRRGRTVVSFDPEKTDAVTQLIYTLFYRVPGSQNFTDFSTTDLIKPTSAKEVAHLVAEIMVALPSVTDVVEQGQQNSRLLQTLLEAESVQNNPHVQSLKTEFGKIKESGSLDKFTHEAKKLFKSAKSPLEPAVVAVLQKDFNKYFENLEQLEKLTKPLNKLLKLSKTSNLQLTAQELVALTYQALNDCRNQPDTYDIDIVYSLWLAFLYKTIQKLVKTDTALERAAFCEYYKKLGALLNVPMALPEQSSLPATIDYEKALQEFKEMVKGSVKNSSELDDLLFYALASKTLPSLEGYATTYFVDKSNKKTSSFPDCMENSIANFIRMLSYDRYSGTYSLNTLEQTIGISLSQTAKDRLTPFFKNVFDHQAWAQLVEDVEYVPYLKNTDSVVANRSIKLKYTQDAQLFEEAGYTIVKDTAYELRPSLRTIIIILDHVLDLNLFDEEKEKEETSLFLRKDFVAHYFPKLCKKLNLEGYYSLTPNDNGVDEAIDKIDLRGVEKIYTVFKSSSGNIELTHTFITDKQHGEYYSALVQSSLLTVDYSGLKNNSFSEHLIVATVLNFYGLDNIISYKTVFAYHLYNLDTAYGIASILPSIPPQNTISTSLNKYLWYLIFEIAIAQPDPLRAIGLLVSLPDNSLFFQDARFLERGFKYIVLPCIALSPLSGADVQLLTNILKRYYDYKTNQSMVIENLLPTTRELSPWAIELIANFYKEILLELAENKELLLEILKNNLISANDVKRQNVYSTIVMLYTLTIIKTDDILYFLSIDASNNKYYYFDKKIRLLTTILQGKLSYEQTHRVVDLLIKNFQFLNNYLEGIAVEENLNNNNSIILPLYILLEHPYNLSTFSYKQSELLQEVQKFVGINNEFLNKFKGPFNNFIADKQEYMRKQGLTQKEN